MNPILLNSDIVMYLQRAEYGQKLAQKIGASRLVTCNVIVAEVLGHDQLEPEERLDLEELLRSMHNINLDHEVTKQVIALRRRYRIQLPDAIIAASALASGSVLWTHNTKDFSHIDGLLVYDPLHDES